MSLQPHLFNRETNRTEGSFRHCLSVALNRMLEASPVDVAIAPGFVRAINIIAVYC